MPRGLKRFYGSGDLHFITCSCYQRRAWLGTPRGRDLFLGLLEETRAKYRFIVLGYVIMPERFHLLISEPQTGDPSMVLQVLKQRYAQRILRPRRQASVPGLFEGHPLHVWQARFYDFNVWTERKRYMHRNPVKLRRFAGVSAAGDRSRNPERSRRNLLEPEQWAWSSFRWYQRGEKGPVHLNETSVMKLRVRTSVA